jgi:hypothetical protein
VGGGVLGGRDFVGGREFETGEVGPAEDCIEEFHLVVFLVHVPSVYCRVYVQ